MRNMVVMLSLPVIADSLETDEQTIMPDVARIEPVNNNEDSSAAPDHRGGGWPVCSNPASCPDPNLDQGDHRGGGWPVCSNGLEG